jgi:uncharacterized protein YggE
MRSFLLAGLILFTMTAHASEPPMPRTVTTTGQAVLRTVPDEATINLGAEVRDAELAVARDRAGAIVEDFLKATRDLGIPANEVATLGARVQPDYEWNRETGERRLRGYVVTRDMSVRLTDLERLGPLIEAATAAGVNQIQPASLTSSRRDQLERQALADAVRDARLRAEAAAGALEADLGDVRTIDAAPPRIQPVARRAEMLAADSGGGGGWQPGEIEIPANVTVTFDLEP